MAHARSSELSMSGPSSLSRQPTLPRPSTQASSSRHPLPLARSRSSTSGRLARWSSDQSSPAPGFQPLPPRSSPMYPPEPPLTLLHPQDSRRRPSNEDDIARVERLELQRETTREANRRKPAWRRALGFFCSGMVNDVRKRAPYYVSDWADAWNYRVVPATLFIFFANILPGIAFSLDLIETTGEYGVQEILLASFMAAFIFSVFGGQPLLISGVTGPITVFNKTIYDIFKGRQDFSYLEFMGWVYVWGAIFHWVSAAFNAVQGLKYVTRFSCDTFGFYVAAVYVQYGIQVVTRQFGQSSTPSAFLGIILALVTLITPHYFNAIARSGYISRGFRRFCSDYGMPITIVAATGLAYWGAFDAYVLEANMTLPVDTTSFQAINGRSWLIRWWNLPGKYVGIAMPFGIVLWILFYFDSNVSSLIAQGSEFPLRKPPGFHWDFFLLGITTFIAALLGIPAPNGLIPQAPLHTASLVVMGYEATSDTSSETVTSAREGQEDRQNTEMTGLDDQRAVEKGLGRSGPKKRGNRALNRVKAALAEEDTQARQRRAEDMKGKREVPVAVVEQRVSNLLQGVLCLVLMTKPFEHVLGLIPKGVLAGLFWFMGTDALLSSGVTEKMLYLIRDRQATSPSDPLNNVRKSRIVLFTLVELVGFGATFAITQTIAAIGFPVIIMLLVPLRVWVVPHLGFSKEELDILDGPVASPFTLESVGGSM